MHLHFERNPNATCDCSILSLSWMGKVPDELPEEDGWKLNRNNYYGEGWLACGNVRGVVGVTYTTSHARPAPAPPSRTNYNLRGHRAEVILVEWNEPYQKLASCDTSGVIFVWIKYEGRWSIELINDRSTPVTHFSWSHDGRMALICYRDGFVLVGSVAGQRYWSSMLTLEARITCGAWTPDDLHVYLGTAAAQLVVMDVHGAMVSQQQLNTKTGGGIRAMAWSCDKFNMEEGGDEERDTNGHVLAVAFTTGELLFMRGHDDPSPVRTNTGLDGATVAMQWTNSRGLLAVAGTVLEPNIVAAEQSRFRNMVKFYSEKGSPLYTVIVPFTASRVTALAWGHAGRRLFVACGGAVHTARVWRVVAPLQLLARVRTAQALPAPSAAASLPLPPRLRPLVAGLFAHTIRCCVPEPASLRRWVSCPPGAARLHCTMLRHEDEDETGGAYTLYLEHLGGLVPLLKGRRTSKIRPEFVIFDPQAETTGNTNTSVATALRASSSSSSSSSGGSAPRATVTDSSESEHDDGCGGSPRLQRRRRARARRRPRPTSDQDELAYLDSLPEEVRLVAVTSNIWGTKFKMHGLAAHVPANLGQLTYKTSLLHLQPRQMTLVITEMQDDVAPQAPPSSSALFSEDEEESTTAAAAAAELPPPPPPIARAPVVERRVSGASAVSRNAISPLRCDGSVPTLQSPKNAVAPTDIIFERPSPQALACGGGGGGGGGGGYTDYTVSYKSGPSEPPFSLNLSGERRHRPDGSHRPDGCLSKLRRRAEELRFIDEESPLECERRARTPTAVAVSPVCAPLPPHIPRSCSVGYLDLVDPAVLRAGLSVAALRREPRRLVLVRSEPPSERPAPLRRSGKSRSLDSAELRPSEPVQSPRPKPPALWTPQPRRRTATVRRSRRDLPACTRCKLVAPYDRRDVPDPSDYVCAACAGLKPASVAPPPAPPSVATTHYSKYYSSLEQLALRLRAARDARATGNSGGARDAGSAEREVASAPSSPRPRRDKRNNSASPIRQLLNSPLLTRRRQKKPSESSDEEGNGGSGGTGGNFRDLESFQKQQLRNKLRRNGGAAIEERDRGASRQLVMHNKAPMWNENSQVYQLDFGGRVTQESAKNFQIEYHGKQVMQFGRIDGKAYTLDFQYPFSALQAFAVALANVTQRLK